jgi:integrase/recombinase XerC
MVLDRFPSTKYQAHIDTLLDRFPHSEITKKNIQYYLMSCKQEGKAPGTLEKITYILRDFAKFCQADHPDAYDIRMFMISLQDRNLSAGTIHTYYRSLKTYFNFLVREEIIDKNPMDNVKAPRLTRVVIKPFSKDDINRMLLLCEGKNFLAYRNKALVLLFLDTGVRLAEMAGIKRADVDIDNQTIKVLGKGQKERVVPFAKNALKALARYLYERDDDLPELWLTEEKRPLKKDGIDSFVNKLCARANITDAHRGAHTFRHTAATMMLRNGASVFTVQQLLGHETLEMTRRYSRTLDSEQVAKEHYKFSPVDNL